MRNVPTISGHQIGQSCFGRSEDREKVKLKERRQGEEEIEESRKEGRWTKRGQRKGGI